MVDINTIRDGVINYVETEAGDIEEITLVRIIHPPVQTNTYVSTNELFEQTGEMPDFVFDVVLEDGSTWWIISGITPTNLYPQDDYETIDDALERHLELLPVDEE